MMRGIQYGSAHHFSEDILAKVTHSLYESEKKTAIEQGGNVEMEKISYESDINRYKGLVKEKRDIQEHTFSFTSVS